MHICVRAEENLSNVFSMLPFHEFVDMKMYISYPLTFNLNNQSIFFTYIVGNV